MGIDRRIAKSHISLYSLFPSISTLSPPSFLLASVVAPPVLTLASLVAIAACGGVAVGCDGDTMDLLLSKKGGGRSLLTQ